MSMQPPVGTQEMPLLRTKLYIPPPRTNRVPRPRLIERLNVGLYRKLTLISASAGFGKTTLVSEWVTGCGRREPEARIAWLSLDKVDHALTYLLEHLPPPPPGLLGGLHLVVVTRKYPHLPLARLRARDELTELRVADLRFTSAKAVGFFNQVMGLNLLAKEIATLETRNKGWAHWRTRSLSTRRTTAITRENTGSMRNGAASVHERSPAYC